MKLILGPLAFVARPEKSRWIEHADGKYGMAITYWQRANWQWGLRISLLWGRRRPFVRVTTYSCLSVGTAGAVKVLECVLSKPKQLKYKLPSLDLTLQPTFESTGIHRLKKHWLDKLR